MSNRIPSVVWVEADTSGRPMVRSYLRRSTPLESWGAEKDEAQVFPSRSAAAAVARLYAGRFTKSGTEDAGLRCPRCGGGTSWIDTFWVCLACGDEWDHDSLIAAGLA
jgi:DNA-directed RNA polymerase subunit RPC12/RpoP